MISQNRFSHHLETLRTMSAISGIPGVNRLAFTDQDWAVRSYLMTELENMGFNLQVDPFGNVISRLEGNDPSLPPIVMGSHTDSVPQGGHYDGLYGILSAIETVKSLQEDNYIFRHPIEIILFMAEESSRFGMATLGSQALLGQLPKDKLHSLKDKQGTTLYEVLKERNLQPDLVGTEVYNKKIALFLEIHIEQGIVLESHHIPLGIVTGIAAPTRSYIHIDGKADHSGATPMNLRHDALCGAAEIILAVEHICNEETNPLVGTVGVIQATPGVMNVIPGRVTLGLDVRSTSSITKDNAMDRITKAIENLCEVRELSFTIEPISNDQPVQMKESVINMMETVAKEHQFHYMKLPSGAGHDAMHWAHHHDVGMIFIPCKDGISHNPAEHASMEHMLQGIAYMRAIIEHVDSN